MSVATARQNSASFTMWRSSSISRLFARPSCFASRFVTISSQQHGRLAARLSPLPPHNESLTPATSRSCHDIDTLLTLQPITAPGSRSPGTSPNPSLHPTSASTDPSTTVVQNGLSMTLAVDQSNYSLGSPVHMTFTETNVSSSPISVITGPSIDGFIITENGTEVWRSNSGPQPMFLRSTRPCSRVNRSRSRRHGPRQRQARSPSPSSRPRLVPTVNFTVS